MSRSRKILVTCALPYANGAIHLGHVIEHIQTDIWVRFQRLRGHCCYFVCADDAHGTPIMLRAEKEGLSPQALIENVHQQHAEDFRGFLIALDHFYSTHSPENRHFAENIYLRLRERGHIIRKTIKQAYDAEKHMFLPDRFIKGQCPHCHAADQYGDSCERCGATYAPTDLIEPYSVISGSRPVEKESEHYFFDLPAFSDFLQDYLHHASIQQSMRNKLQEWFDAELQAWDISRDAPYWGFAIPDAQDKYFYVWLDAPIGYMASFQNFCTTNHLDFDDFWREDSEAELYHFIGKDIAYFHMLFWPAMLKGAGYRLPNGIFCHGFLTVNGEKMSKSRGTFIQAHTYLKHLSPEYLRYYLAAKLGQGIDDIDLNLDDLKNKVNSDLVGKLVNLASRSAKFIERYFDGRLSAALPENDLFHANAAAADTLAACYESRDYARAMREIMKMADAANEYIDHEKPWLAIKDPAQAQHVHEVCTLALNLFHQLLIYLQPVLPHLCEQGRAFLKQETAVSWQDVEQTLLNQKIEAYAPLMTRVEDRQIHALLEDSKQDLQKAQEATPQAAPEPASIKLQSFEKMDLRVARVLNCEKVEGSNKLLRFELDVGELGKRQIFSGIQSAYAPEQLIGRHVVIIANLEPRKMRFGVSQGMILSASDAQGIFLLNVDEGARAGMSIH